MASASLEAALGQSSGRSSAASSIRSVAASQLNSLKSTGSACTVNGFKGVGRARRGGRVVVKGELRSKCLKLCTQIDCLRTSESTCCTLPETTW